MFETAPTGCSRDLDLDGDGDGALSRTARASVNDEARHTHIKEFKDRCLSWELMVGYFVVLFFLSFYKVRVRSNCNRGLKHAVVEWY